MDKQALTDFIEGRLGESEYFLVDVKVDGDNNVVVEIDGPEGVDIDYCVDLSRDIEAAFSRDEEDYSLEVGSAGLTAPFKVLGQYLKNIGNEVEVLTADGRKLKGRLDEADEEVFTIGIPTKVKAEGEKRPHIEEVPTRFGYNEIKYTKYLLQF